MVDHKIILKIEFYGIRGIPYAWFASHLSNRKQIVSIGDTNLDFHLLLVEYLKALSLDLYFSLYT